MRTVTVITGDIVNSTRLSMEEREIMLDTLNAIPEIVRSIDGIKMEIFRGDGFQILVPCIKDSLKIAIIIRAYLKSINIGNNKFTFDARLAVGIGRMDYESVSLATSDGEAFRLSGRLLDDIKDRRLEIITPWGDINDELNLSTAFVDDIISSWTRNQSRIILSSLIKDKSHYDIAAELGISRQMVDKSLRASKENLIRLYLKRFVELLSKHIPEIC